MCSGPRLYLNTNSLEKLDGVNSLFFPQCWFIKFYLGHFFYLGGHFWHFFAKYLPLVSIAKWGFFKTVAKVAS